jgi:DNA-binding SARP family transcriptional activator
MTRFRVLGPFEIEGDDGAPIAISAAKHRAVLTVLLLRAGHVVSTDFLIDTVWGENPPKAVSTALQNAISALRKALGADLVRTRPPGYVLELNGGSLDLLEFEQLVRDAAGKEGAERAAVLREALDLWRGEPLPEFQFDGLAPELRRLEELRLLTEEDWLEAELEAGHAAELVPRLEFLVRESPERDSLWGMLMLALYRSGRQADALAAYRAARASSIERIGSEPSPELQEINRSIIRQDPRLLRPSAAAASPAEHLEEVATILLAGKLVPVLGGDVERLAAALARRFDVPPSDGTGRARAGVSPGPPRAATELTRAAQYVALTKGSGPLYEELQALLAAEAQVTELHRFFAALPPFLRERELPHQLLVTTSYDLALEQALLDAGEEFDVVAYIPAGRDRGRFCHREPNGATHVIDVPNTYATELSLERRTIVLKLQGGLDRGADVVVTEDDFIGYLAQGDVSSAIPVALAARLRRSHFLFLGYGMREWSLRLVLDRMWGGEAPAYRSWAVVPEAQPLERQFWRTRDVDLLELPLDEYGNALARYLGTGAEAAA